MKDHNFDFFKEFSFNCHEWFQEQKIAADVRNRLNYTIAKLLYLQHMKLFFVPFYAFFSKKMTQAGRKS